MVVKVLVASLHSDYVSSVGCMRSGFSQNSFFNLGHLSFSWKIWRFAAKNRDFSMICQIARDAADAQTESLTGQGSPVCDRQILLKKDSYPYK